MYRSWRATSPPGLPCPSFSKVGGVKWPSLTARISAPEVEGGGGVSGGGGGVGEVEGGGGVSGGGGGVGEVEGGGGSGEVGGGGGVSSGGGGVGEVTFDRVGPVPLSSLLGFVGTSERVPWVGGDLGEGTHCGCGWGLYSPVRLRFLGWARGQILYTDYRPSRCPVPSAGGARRSDLKTAL